MNKEHIIKAIVSNGRARKEVPLKAARATNVCSRGKGRQLELGGRDKAVRNQCAIGPVSKHTLNPITNKHRK